MRAANRQPDENAHERIPRARAGDRSVRALRALCAWADGLRACALSKLVLGAFGRLLELVPQALEDADEGCKPRSLLRPVHHRARPLAPPQQPAQVDARVLHFHGFRASYRK